MMAFIIPTPFACFKKFRYWLEFGFLTGIFIGFFLIRFGVEDENVRKNRLLVILADMVLTGFDALFIPPDKTAQDEVIVPLNGFTVFAIDAAFYVFHFPDSCIL
jgi:hypothetical protein